MLATANIGSEIFVPENIPLSENETYTILQASTSYFYGRPEKFIKLRNNWKDYKTENPADKPETIVTKYSDFIKRFRLVVAAEVLGQGKYKSMSIRSDKYEGSYFKIEADEEG